MGYEKIRSIRPLTKLMLDLLKDCYYREKNNLQQVPFVDKDLVKGLVDRGLLQNNPKSSETEKPFLVTELGKEYIEHYFGK